MEFFRFMWDQGLVGKLMLAIIVLVIIMIPVGIYGAIQEAEEWRLFASENNCKIISRVKGDTKTNVGYGITSNGQFGTIVTTSSTPIRLNGLVMMVSPIGVNHNDAGGFTMAITKSTNRGYTTWIATQRIGNGTLLVESVERHTAWRELIELIAKTAKVNMQ